MIIYFLRMWRSKSFLENKRRIVQLKEEIESFVVRTVCGFAFFKFFSSFQCNRCENTIGFAMQLISVSKAE